MAVLEEKPLTLKNGKTLILRSCEPKDAEAFLDYHHAIASESNFTLLNLELPPDFQKMKAHYEATRAHPRDLLLHAWDGPRLVGQISLRQESPGHPVFQHVGIFGMSVRKEFSGQGLGRALLEAMHCFSDASGFERIEARVRTENIRALGLYLRVGYQIEGVRRAMAKIGDSFRDEYLIARLNPGATKG